MSCISALLLALAVLASSGTGLPTLSPRDDLPPMVPYNTRAGDADLVLKLMTASTAAERSQLLNQPGDHVFDFNVAGNPPSGAITNGKGGTTVAATSKSFPALIGNGVGMTIGFLDACSINSPHVHNRGTEFNIVVEGQLVTNAMEENGALAFQDLLSKYQATVFPQGSIHTEFNPSCEPAVFVAGFNSVDPGVSQISQNFFRLRPDIVEATLGDIQTFNGQDIDSFRHMIPDNVVLGIEQCLQTCDIQKRAKRSVEDLLLE